jgi:hypothetical protein
MPGEDLHLSVMAPLQAHLALPRGARHEDPPRAVSAYR